MNAVCGKADADLQRVPPMAHETEELAAVDLGSNSFHMLIARVEGGRLTVIDRLRERVQLAAGFDEQNNLTTEAMERGIACLERFGQRLEPLERVRVRAVGTNTLRKAKNARMFLARAQQVLGHRIEVISGREEARIVYLGVAHSISDDAGRRLVVDIGGGSTECIIGERFEARKTESLHMGCVSHTLGFFGDGKLRRESFRAAVTAARVELETIERDFRRTGWVSAVGSSGTITAIDGILKANGWDEDGITRAGLRSLREHLIEAGRISKVSLAGLSTDRASVLPGGLAVLMGAFKSLKIDRMMASTGALREGLLYDTIGRSTHEDVRVQTIASMCQRYSVDLDQASRVEATALRCLDQVAYPWALHHPDLRQMLSWSARLHEIGLALSYSGNNHHGAYLVANTEMPGFSHEKQAFLAALIRAHRRRLRSDNLAELRQAGGDEAIYLAIILRLAAALNRGRDPQPLPTFTLDVAANTIELRFPKGWLAKRPLTSADLENEREWLAETGFNFSVG
jgi:exopolyphosphatase / guanosine-5'-triphosphate,3'-diphosphate pyrophosphatase